uniref:Ovule protein n=1 Tax=Caenorhabditis tropicalis TaxID=1561998 RepID=A0A1I7T1W4_9PELO
MLSPVLLIKLHHTHTHKRYYLVPEENLSWLLIFVCSRTCPINTELFTFTSFFHSKTIFLCSFCFLFPSDDSTSGEVSKTFNKKSEHLLFSVKMSQSP